MGSMMQDRLRADPAALPDEEVFFAANRAWELDRATLLERSERRAWIVGGTGRD